LRAGRWGKIVVEEKTPELLVVMVRAIGSHVWIGSNWGFYKWIEKSDTFQKLLDVGALDVAEDAGQRPWITDFAHGFRAVTGPEPAGGFEGKGLRLLSDRRGNLWVGTIGEGLWRVRFDDRKLPIVEKASLNTGLLSDSVQALRRPRREYPDRNDWRHSAIDRAVFTPVANITSSRRSTPSGTVWAGTNTACSRPAAGSDNGSGNRGSPRSSGCEASCDRHVRCGGPDRAL
jgi:hypothetical protein